MPCERNEISLDMLLTTAQPESRCLIMLHVTGLRTGLCYLLVYTGVPAGTDYISFAFNPEVMAPGG